MAEVAAAATAAFASDPAQAGVQARAVLEARRRRQRVDLVLPLHRFVHRPRQELALRLPVCSDQLFWGGTLRGHGFQGPWAAGGHVGGWQGLSGYVGWRRVESRWEHRRQTPLPRARDRRLAVVSC